MLKKFLSLALAVMMIVSLFSLSVNAVALGSMGLKLESDAVIGSPVNTIVTVKVHYTFNENEDLSVLAMVPAAVTVAYDSEYYEYVADSRTFADYYLGIIKTTSSINLNGWAAVSVGIAANANDSAKNYSKALIVGQLPETGVTHFFPDRHSHVFSLQFKVIKALDKEAYIGIPESSLGKQTQLKRYVAGKSVTLTAAEMDATDTINKSNRVGVNFAENTKVRCNTDDPTKVDLGFTGSFLNAGIPIAFDGSTATNVTKVGVEVTINGNTIEAEDDFVYENAGGDGYLFRAALTGIPAASFDTPIKVRMFVEYDGDYYYSDYVTTTVAAHVGRLG